MQILYPFKCSEHGVQAGVLCSSILAPYNACPVCLRLKEDKKQQYVSPFPTELKPQIRKFKIGA